MGDPAGDEPPFPSGITFSVYDEIQLRNFGHDDDEQPRPEDGHRLSPNRFSSTPFFTPKPDSPEESGTRRLASSRLSYRREKRKLPRMASIQGDTELNDYMDSLARDPDRFLNPHNADTAETILHLLAKEGKVEILQNLLDDPRLEQDLVRALLQQDKLGWNPVMAATKADSGGVELVEMFLGFLEAHLDHPQDLERLLGAENIGKDTLFTLLMKNPDSRMDCDNHANSRRILFNILCRTARCDDDIYGWVIRFVQQLLTPNSCDLTSRSMREVINLCAEFHLSFFNLLSIKDADGNTLLMELAKNMKDDALREILTNSATCNEITHSILVSKNVIGQTLLTLIEVNRESLSESLPLVLKKEYGCHRREIVRTELCLSEQLETSASASEIIQELHQLEPKSCCQIFVIWAVLFLTSLTPNIGLAVSDILSDTYLTVEYHSNMMNDSYVEMHSLECQRLKNETPIPLQAYASCLDAKSKFWYTITFLLIPLFFYLTEFITLTDEYEPTGLRKRVVNVYQELRMEKHLLTWSQFFTKVMVLIALVIIIVFALILWQPVTAACKFYRDARYEASEGTIKVVRHKEKRYVDLAASRGELIEVSIEAVFEPMVQGYIIFPSIIDIIQRLAKSVTVSPDGSLKIDFLLKGMETAQIFSICVSMVSLAWCYSEYNSVRKNMLLDVTVSPCSRIVMCLYMLLQIVARLLAFMLFTLYWGPGNFYPLMIFIAVHMAISSLLHIVFSEDLVYWQNKKYIKFFHNVMMNAFSTIYFHNYLRFDEMPKVDKDHKDEQQPLRPDRAFVDSQRPGLHISTFLRQLMFDMLYILEYVVLLAFGFSSDVKDLIDQERKPILMSVIIVLSLLALLLKFLYYNFLHVWRGVIVSGKKLIRQEFDEVQSSDQPKQAALRKRFFKYVFITRNTWILGKLKHIETTLIVLPTRIIEAIKGRGQDLENNFTDVTKQVDKSWFDSPIAFFSSFKFNSFLKFIMVFPLVILVIVINLAIIALLIIGLLLTIPVAIVVFLYNLKSGFRAVEITDEEEDQNTLELPPEISSDESGIFQSLPDKTLASFQKNLEENGTIDLSKKVDITAEELEVFTMLLLSLNRKKYPFHILILDNCDITNEKLIKLAPLIVKFEKVTLNGSQKMTSLGWERLREAIFSSTNCRLRRLELKISKNDDDVIRFRREILLEELKGSTMSPEALKTIGRFMPRLEMLFLDDIFNDTNLLDMIKSRNDNMMDAWKDVARSIISCRLTDRKIRCLSLVGCAINDDVIIVLAPALVQIKMIHLGRNPITAQGWEFFRHCFEDELSRTTSAGAELTHLSLNMLTDSGSGGSSKFMLNSLGMEQLARIIPFFEEVDLSGQCELGAEGWSILAAGFTAAYDRGRIINLKSLSLRQCKIKADSRYYLEEALTKVTGNLRIDFGKDDVDSKRRKGCLTCV